MKQVGILIGGVIVSWAVLLAPGWLLGGERAILHATVALVICLAPAVATLVWALKPGADILVAVLGGTGIRLLVVLGSGFLLRHTWPDAFPDAFWIWIGIFYLITLALEVALVVRLKQDSTAN